MQDGKVSVELPGPTTLCRLARDLGSFREWLLLALSRSGRNNAFLGLQYDRKGLCRLCCPNLCRVWALDQSVEWLVQDRQLLGLKGGRNLTQHLSVDALLRFSRLDLDFSILLQALGLQPQTLPKRNLSNRSSLPPGTLETFDEHPELVELVEHHFRDDMSTFASF